MGQSRKRFKGKGRGGDVGQCWDYDSHYHYWSELGDGGRRFHSNAQTAAFSAPMANGQKSAGDDPRVNVRHRASKKQN